MNKTKDITPLTPAVFYILLALIGEKRHGYDIMNQVEIDSDGLVAMGPGTLYGSIDRMIESGLIERTPSQPKESRRIYYQITAKGRTVFQAEVERFSAAIRIASKRKFKTT